VLVAPRRRLLPAALPVAETGNLALAAGDVADRHVRRLHARGAGKERRNPRRRTPFVFESILESAHEQPTSQTVRPKPAAPHSVETIDPLPSL
jgi:hypothetical protein